MRIDKKEFFFKRTLMGNVLMVKETGSFERKATSRETTKFIEYISKLEYENDLLREENAELFSKVTIKDE